MRRKYSAGFTIVELLIVVVVIAILAAITIVAYNGIKDRASDASLKSSASQAGKKVLAFASLNNDQFPSAVSYQSDLALPGNSAQATYDYYTSDDRKSFCISVTDTTKAPKQAYALTDAGQMMPGKCVRNLLVNPSFESGSASSWSMNTTGLGGATGTTTIATSGYTGSRSLKYSFTGPGTLSNFGPYTLVTNMSATKSYALSVSVRSSKALSYQVGAELRDSAGVRFNTVNSSPVTLTPNVWTQITLIISPTANLDRLTMVSYGAGAVQSGDSIDWDGFLLVEGGDRVVYTQGLDDMWAWQAAANASQLFGPALLQ